MPEYILGMEAHDKIACMVLEELEKVGIDPTSEGGISILYDKILPKATGVVLEANLDETMALFRTITQEYIRKSEVSMRMSDAIALLLSKGFTREQIDRLIKWKQSRVVTDEYTDEELMVGIRTILNTIQNINYNPTEHVNPSEVEVTPWLYARREEGVYPESTIHSGKWLIRVSDDEVDEAWVVIKDATRKGLLGNTSKCATRYSKGHGTKIIHVYTYDYHDKEDVLRVANVIEGLGFVQKIWHKLYLMTMRKVSGSYYGYHKGAIWKSTKGKEWDRRS